MASEKQILKWTEEAKKINDNPKYIQAYIEYKQLAKKVDQRLVRLEALSHEQHFGGVLEFAYRSAIRDIKSWGGDRRFNTAPPVKLTELQAKIADMEKFEASETSTKSKILGIYKKRADTINKRYAKEFGVKFTWEDIANYYEDKDSRRQDVKLSSKTEVRALAVLKKLSMDKKDMKDIQDSNEKIKRITGGDKILVHEVQRIMKQGLDYNKLMGGN